MAGSKDHYMPLTMLPDQLMTLTAAHSVTARVFTEAESAQNHCQIGNMGLALKVILNWLDETGGRAAHRTLEAGTQRAHTGRRAVHRDLRGYSWLARHDPGRGRAPIRV